MEMLDIYDENRNHIGTEDRKVVHQKGLWHNTVHCWLYDNNGNVFFQRRADKGTLYTTASGHVSAGETITQAFGREVFEELGSNIDYEKAEFANVVKFMMDRPEKDGSVFKDRAFAHIYVYNYNKDYDFNYDFDEISEIVKVNAKDALSLFQNENGEINGETIYIENGNIKTKNSKINFNEFLVNNGETAVGKYGDVLNKVIELTS